MTTLQLADRAVIAGTRMREDGSLLADARIARTGIQLYLGKEVGKPSMDVVRVYRPGEEVFSEDTMKSAAHKAVTNDHPPELVDASNWKKYSVGGTADEVTGERIFIRVPLMVSDAAAIKDIENGKRELSAGYTCSLDWTAGVTESGEKYDAIQRNIRLNHVAIVSAGRAGHEVRIGDDATSWGGPALDKPIADRKEPEMELRTVMVDGLSVQTTDQGAQAIDKLRTERDTAIAAIQTANSTHQTALAAKDTELATKDARIDELTKAQLTGDALDALVATRSALIADAQLLHPEIKIDGLSTAKIKLTALEKSITDGSLTGKPEAYIDARFDLAVEAAKKDRAADPFRKAPIGDNQPQPRIIQPGQFQDQRPAAHAAYVADLENAWKGDEPKGSA